MDLDYEALMSRQKTFLASLVVNLSAITQLAINEHKSIDDILTRNKEEVKDVSKEVENSIAKIDHNDAKSEVDKSELNEKQAEPNEVVHEREELELHVKPTSKAFHNDQVQLEFDNCNRGKCPDTIVITIKF